MPVINKYYYNNTIPSGAVNIMRGSIFGNPFKISNDCPRQEVISLYRKYLWKRINEDLEFANQVKGLHGKTLCCCCAPLACHGDVLEACANWMVETDFC